MAATGDQPIGGLKSEQIGVDEEPSGPPLSGVFGGDDLAVHHDHRSDRQSLRPEASLRNRQRLAHEPLVVVAHKPISGASGSWHARTPLVYSWIAETSGVNADGDSVLA